MHPSRYLKVFPCSSAPGQHLLFSVKQASIIRVNDRFLRAFYEGALPPEKAARLARLGMAVDDPAEEKRAVHGFFDRLNANDPELHLTVVLNLDCNFACTYCYEGQAKAGLYMSAQTADRVIDFMRANFTPGKTALRIDFYGGEPLLSMDRIRQVADAARSLAREKGASCRFNLVTNGSLFRRRVAEELADLGLERVRITVDGPAETHNRSRPFKNGAGSFDTVIQNIADTCDRVRIGIGGNYERHNYRLFPSLLDHMRDTGLTPGKIGMVKFDPVMKPPEGDPALPEYSGGCASINEPWIREAEAFLREEILKRGYATQKVRPVTCMVEIRDSWVIHFDGTLYKCPAFIGKPEFAAGHVETGIRSYGAAYKTAYWKNETCAECVYLPLCFGGCRYMSYVRNGAISEVDCRRQYLDAALETLVRQDARYAGKKTTRA